MAELRDEIAEALVASRTELRPLVNELSGAVAAFKIVAYREKFLSLIAQAYKAKLDTHLVLDAKEAARRTERELMLAIASGRRDGSIESAQDARERAGWVAARKRGGQSLDGLKGKFPKFPVPSFLTAGDMSGQFKNGVNYSIWLLAEIDDEQFNKIISRLRRARALSHVAVLEAIRLMSDNAPAQSTGPIPSNRVIVSNALEHLHSVGTVLSAIPELSADIDQKSAATLLADLKPQITTLNRIQKLLKNRAEQ